MLLSAGEISAVIIAMGAICFGMVACGARAIGKYFAVGAHARAMIAVGRTKAVGSVYHASEFTELVKKDVVILLHQEVPRAFHWIVDLIEFFLNPNYGIPSGEILYPNPENILYKCYSAVSGIKSN